VGVTLEAPVPRPRSKPSETSDPPPIDPHRPKPGDSDAVAAWRSDPPPIDPHRPKPGDSDAVAAWRIRMGTDDAKQIYTQRAATARR
jgi:hypothetical protein